MNSLVTSLWAGLVNGAATRQKAQAPLPEALGYTGTIATTLYWAAFEVSNALVYGAPK